MWKIQGRKIYANSKCQNQTENPRHANLYKALHVYRSELKRSARLYETALSSVVRSRIGFSHLPCSFFGFYMNLSKYILYPDGCVCLLVWV